MAEDLKATARRFNDEIMNQGKLEVIDEIIADGLVEHAAPPGWPPGKEGVRAYVAMMRDAFPDLKVETLAVVAEGDEVWMHSVMTGTHTGELMGIPATGKSVSLAMFDRVKVSDGKAVEHWGVSDDLGMMTQLGVVPEMG
jgi:predicted ester cyclase